MNFGGIVAAWYKKNLRELPWRQTRDPYRVWLSEVILQQTRVNQGLDYYNRFVSAFPDLPSLAAASEDQVMKMWQGLGYYSRARNMHSAARQLVEFNGGLMPDSYEGLLGMKGVGTYTAAAVASICFGEAKAVVDGNVARVIARIYGMEEAINSPAGKKTLERLADQLLSDNKEFSPGTHNQAMMEFGALHCLPRSPLCGDCPLKNGCNARLSNRVEKLPLKNKKKKPLPRWMYFYVFTGKGETILTRRKKQGIWGSLYHFPVLESPVEIRAEEMLGNKLRQILSEMGTLAEPEALAGQGSLAEEASPEAYANISRVSETIKHQLTHLTIYARFIHVELADLPSPINENFHRTSLDKLDQYAIPRLMERYMEVAKF